MKFTLLLFMVLVTSYLSATEGDDFFDDTPLVNENPEVQKEFKDELLQISPITWGGSYFFSIGVHGTWNEYLWDKSSGDSLLADGEDSKVDLGASLFFSARPSVEQKYYGKFKINYPFSLDAATFQDVNKLLKVPNITVWELYADFPLFSGVNIRAGKQMSSWGVGYFFKPADILSLSPVDPNNPKNEVEGPVMVKANIPFDINNLDLYVIASSNLTSVKDLAYAARVNFVVSGFEFGLGTRYQQIAEGIRGSNWQTMATISGSIWKFGVFAEALVTHGTSKGILEEDITVPFIGYKVKDTNEDWFFKATVGFNYLDSENHFQIFGQYLFNGEGYDGDLSVLKAPLLAYIGQSKISATDASNLAKHYFALSANFDFAADSKVHAGLFCLGSFQDWSGIIKPSIRFDIGDYLDFTLNATVKFGDSKSEYGGNDFIKPINMGFDISVGNGAF